MEQLFLLFSNQRIDLFFSLLYPLHFLFTLSTMKRQVSPLRQDHARGKKKVTVGILRHTIRGAFNLQHLSCESHTWSGILTNIVLAKQERVICCGFFLQFSIPL